ncbi:MAG: redoxin domain-containing protein [Alphaproteobacteria bacterium]|nr:redoxin domain-containing protein [Alphaproteobacteria bacterium]
MKLFSTLLMGTLAVSTAAFARPASDFTLMDANGTPVSLSDFSDKIVVLEWTNRHCPFVRKFYDEGHMAKVKQNIAGDDLVWITINSSAEGKQGHVNMEEALKLFESDYTGSTAYLRDPDGKIGKLYGAQTTPHMFVIQSGEIVYEGAIDSIPSYRSSDIEKAENYVASAVKALRAGTSIATATSKPYGCGVKY